MFSRRFGGVGGILRRVKMKDADVLCVVRQEDGAVAMESEFSRIQ